MWRQLSGRPEASYAPRHTRAGKKPRTHQTRPADLLAGICTIRGIHRREFAVGVTTLPCPGARLPPAHLAKPAQRQPAAPRASR